MDERTRIQTGMELIHHQAMLRESDGMFVCSRCGLINPSDDQPCIPNTIEPSAQTTSVDPEGNAA
ncbi:MAG TPA: hypothetical protein VFP40_11075 [Terriglobales bacterium]|nr:hypothetical protein [Terriglobales bacterium]